MWMEWRSCGTFVCPVRSVLVERGPTNRRSVNAALNPLSCMTGSTWGSWPCYPWCYTGFLLSGTLERRGGSIYTFQWFLLLNSLSDRMWHLWREIQFCASVVGLTLSSCYVFSSSALLQHVTAMLECCVSAVVTLLVTEPVGQLSIRSCQVQMLSDWYTMLYNPSPDYVNTLHCTQEAVYPL